jgi:octopine/nopaline transport system permease protein
MDTVFLLDTTSKILAALPTTLALFICCVSLGCVFALGLTAMRVSNYPLLSGFAKVYIFIFRGSPLLVQMFLIYYGLGQFAAIRQSFAWVILRDPFDCAVLSLALCTAGYQAEIMRGSLQAVPAREIEAARAIGMSGFLLLRRIIIPIAIRQALPTYSTEMVLMVKSTALASLVTVWEMTGIAQRLITQTYRTMEIFLITAAIYLLLNFVLVRMFALLDYWLSPHLRARPSHSSGKTA